MIPENRWLDTAITSSPILTNRLSKALPIAPQAPSEIDSPKIKQATVKLTSQELEKIKTVTTKLGLTLTETQLQILKSSPQEKAVPFIEKAVLQNELIQAVKEDKTDQFREILREAKRNGYDLKSLLLPIIGKNKEIGPYFFNVLDTPLLKSISQEEAIFMAEVTLPDSIQNSDSYSLSICSQLLGKSMGKFLQKALQHNLETTPDIEKQNEMKRFVKENTPDTTLDEVIESILDKNPTQLATLLLTSTDIAELLHSALQNIESEEDSKTFKTLLHETIGCLDASENGTHVKEYLTRVTGYADALWNFDYKMLKLTPFESLKIATFAERLSDLPPPDLTIYVPRGTEGLSKPVILDFSTKSVIVLPKKESPFQASGSFKKVTLCAEASLKTVTEQPSTVWVRSVNNPYRTNTKRYTRGEKRPEVPISQTQKAVDEMKKEIAIARLFDDDVRLIVFHSNKISEPKMEIIETFYELGDLDDYTANPLYNKKERKPLTDDHLFEICLQVGNKLAQIHDARYVHNDIKAPNILAKLNPDGSWRVKITDYGLAYNQPSDRIDPDDYGTADYTAPELKKDALYPPFEDPITQGQAEDAYALGALLYELMEPDLFDPEQFNYDAFKSKVEALDDGLKKSIALAAVSLLNPNPRERVTAQEFFKGMHALNPERSDRLLKR